MRFTLFVVLSIGFVRKRLESMVYQVGEMYKIYYNIHEVEFADSVNEAR